MKSHLESHRFTPVVLTLESQAEVDALFAVFNHTWVVDAIPALAGAYQTLESYHNRLASDLIHEALSGHLKGKKRQLKSAS